MHLLALSGSLRAASLNTGALRALQKLAPEGVAVSLYEGIGALPHFNSDVEMSALPEGAVELRRQVAAADGTRPRTAPTPPQHLYSTLRWPSS